MISFLANFINFFRAIWRGLRDSEFQVLLTLTAITLISGTLFYRYAEGWSVLDSLYFSVITLTTVGYGDLSPSTPLSKIFTMAYLMVGIGIIVAFVNKIASDAVSRRAEKALKKQERKEKFKEKKE